MCFGTSGPGATNLVTGICNAHMDSVPLVAITANVPNSMIGTDAFQEADITGITIPITKQNYFVRNGKDLPRVIREAFHLARTGRPGPVHVDVPKDVLLTEIEWNGYPTSVDLPGYQPTLEPNMRQVKEAARLIERAQRPVIIAGQGVLLSGAWDELRSFAEKTRIPVMTTLLGISGFPENHPLSLGLPRHARLGALQLRRPQLGPGDLDRHAHGRPRVRQVRRLRAAGQDRPHRHRPGRDRQERARRRADRRRRRARADQARARDPARRAAEPRGLARPDRDWREQYPPKRYPTTRPSCTSRRSSRRINRATRGEAVIVADVGQHQMFAAQHYQYTQPYSYITSGGLGTMGYSLPAAIGAQMARPDKQVWCVVGDGCFQMTLQELAVLAAHRVPVKIALLNNEYLGMVRQQQQVQYQRQPGRGRPGGRAGLHQAGAGVRHSRLAGDRARPARQTRLARRWPTRARPSSNSASRATEDVYPWVLGGTSLGEVLPDTPYEAVRERVLAGAGPSPKDGSDR